MKLEYEFTNKELLKVALTHPSLTKDKRLTSYEKLEFLGDNILNLILAEALYKQFPEFDEGRLSQVHANLVCTETLAEIARQIGLDQVIMLDRGEEANRGRTNKKNLENCLEALIAAIYLDSDYYTVRGLFLPLWQPFIENKEYALKRDAKSLLQEWSQKFKLGLPKYSLIKEAGLAHSKMFTVNLSIEGYKDALGSGSSIKKAEVEAAQNFIKVNGIE
jgi:ribonuclease III